MPAKNNEANVNSDIYLLTQPNFPNHDNTLTQGPKEILTSASKSITSKVVNRSGTMPSARHSTIALDVKMAYDSSRFSRMLSMNGWPL